MKLSHLAAPVAAAVVGIGLVSCFSAPTEAQNQGQAPAPRTSGHNIAVVDVSVIFKKHQRFLANTEKFKKDVEAAENKLKEEYNQIKAMQEQLKRFNAGSQEYKDLEQRVARAGADWQIKGATHKKELLEIEGRIYFQVYKELDDSVKRFAQANDIALVLRYASDPVDDANDRNEIVRGINKSVVYVKPDLDITDWILQDLNRSPAVSTNPGAPVGVRRQ